MVSLASVDVLSRRRLIQSHEAGRIDKLIFNLLECLLQSYKQIIDVTILVILLDRHIVLINNYSLELLHSFVKDYSLLA